MNFLSIWTVYRRPDDFPEHFVARRHEVKVGGKLVVTDEILIADTLDGVRAQLPPGLHRIVRQPDDKPSIVETWL
jgi:hypothetical protein